jgi:UPF0755 protein
MIRVIIKLILLFAVFFAMWFVTVVISGNDIEEGKIFVIESGQGVNQISENLHEQNIIKSKFVFETWLWLKKSESRVVAGAYSLPENISIRQLSNLLVVGPEKAQGTITLLEGWSRPFMAEAADKVGLLEQTFLRLTNSKLDWEDDYDFLADAPNSATLEGYLFPDTYYIDEYTSVEDLVIKCLNNFDRKMTDELRKETDRQGKTIFEVITLASIIEREVPAYADKKMIADIFLKRLEVGIGLQSDATINFITGKKDPTPSLDDLAVESPYNTYKYRGLTPGPISSPGIESIEAVLYPSSNPYYYFLTTPTGEVIYSVDHDEHVANKNKYLK